jgi:hypothetical protein
MLQATSMGYVTGSRSILGLSLLTKSWAIFEAANAFPRDDATDYSGRSRRSCALITAQTTTCVNYCQSCLLGSGQERAKLAQCYRPIRMYSIVVSGTET